MLRKFWKRIARGHSRSPRPVRKKHWQGKVWLGLEPLADRIVPAVTATFSPGAGILTVLGWDRSGVRSSR